MKSCKLAMPEIIIVVLIFPFLSHAKETAKPIYFEPKVGASFVLNIHNEKIRYQEDTKIQEIKAATKVDVKILGKSDATYDVLWKFNKTDIHSVYPENDFVTPLLEDLNQGLVVKLKVDTVGTIVKIINAEEIKSYMHEVLKRLLSLLETKGAPPDFIDKLKQQLAPLISNDDALQQTILKEPSLYFSGYGIDFTESNTIRYESNLPNPLTGAPILARGEYRLSGSSDSYIVDWEQVVDREAAILFVQDFLKRFNQNVPPPDQLPPFDITDRATFRFKGSNITLIDHERMIETLGMKRIDRKKMELDNPK